MSRRFFLALITISIVFVLSGCSEIATSQPEPESTPVITVTEVPLPQVVEETPSVTSTSASTPETDETETQQEAVVNVKEGVFTLAKVEIDGHYLPGLEILELGNVVEDCQRLYLTFYLTGEDPVSDSMWFQYKISASQYRAIVNAFVSEGLIEKTGDEQPSYIDLSHLGYEMEISVGSEEFPLYKIISPSGVIWDSNAQIPPRQLNDVESAYYKGVFIDSPYSAARLLDLDNYDVYDPREKSREEVCSDYYRSNNNIDLSRFSVLEAEARRLVLTTYLENNPDVFLIVNYYRGDVFNDKVGELVVSDASGVLTPFASDRLSSFYRTNNSSVNIRFSKNEDTMGLAFNPREFGIVSIGSSVDFQEYINDISSWGFSPNLSLYGRSVSTFWISPKDLNIRNLVSASLLVLTDDDVVEILEGMTKN